MNYITSYSSSDSENETVPVDSKQQLNKLEKTEEQVSSYSHATYEKGITQKQCELPVKIINHEHADSSTSSNSDHFVKNTSTNLKRNRIETNMVPTKNAIKPYIPKSKQAKLLNKSGSNLEHAGQALQSPFKLSEIFQKAKVFIKQVNLHQKIPRSQFANFEAHQGCVSRISWNPSFYDFLLSGSMDSAVKIWNVQTTPCCVYEIKNHSQAVKDAKWSYDGLQVLSGGYDNTARITDVNLGKQISELKHNSFVTSVQYHPSNHNVFLSGTSNDGIFAWDIRMQSIVTTYKSFFGQVQDLIFYPDGKSFISAAEVLKRNSTDKGIMVWDFKTSTILSNQVFQEAYTCTALQLHSFDNVFLAQCNAGYIAVFSQKSPYKLNKYKRFEGHQVSGYHIGFDISGDGSLVASGSADGCLPVYNYRTSKLLKTFPSHSQPCMDVAWSPCHPGLLASCDWNGIVALHR